MGLSKCFVALIISLLFIRGYYYCICSCSCSIALFSITGLKWLSSNEKITQAITAWRRPTIYDMAILSLRRAAC